MISKVTLNARKPNDDEYGNQMLEHMNNHHRALHSWAYSNLVLSCPDKILDIGYGGGQNIKNLLSMYESAKIYGIDYSMASYKKCSEINSEDIKNGRVQLEIGSADNLPYSDNTFDLVVAFETTYYWPNIEKCFKKIYDILKTGGKFLICNEDSYLDGNEEIAQRLDMQFYNATSFTNLLKGAGFDNIEAVVHENNKWVTMIATK